MILKKNYPIGEYMLTWEFDDSERIIASELPVDNLYIEGLWNIKDTAPKDNLCTGCQVIDDETFVFTTFGGGRFVMKIKDGVIELASRMLTK